MKKFAPGGRGLWWQTVISSTGDGMFLTAFPLLAASLTRDPGAIAGVTVAGRAAWIFFTLPLGALADRHNRRWLMVTADILRGVVVTLLAATVITGTAEMWMLYTAALLLNVGEVLHTTAAQAMFPALIPDEQLVEFNSSITAAQAATETFIGPPLGAAMFAASPSLPFVADAISFGGSIVLAMQLPDVHQPSTERTRVLDDVEEGWRYLFAHPLLKRLALLIGGLNTFYFASEAVLVLYTFEKLNAGKVTFTALFLSGAVGLIVGQRFIPMMQRHADARIAISFSLWLWAISLAGLALTSSPIVACAMWFVLGFGDAFWRVLTSAIRQKITPNHLLGRVLSVHRLFAMGAMSVGAAIGGVVSKLVDLRAPYVMAAIAFFIFALAGPRYLEPARGL